MALTLAVLLLAFATSAAAQPAAPGAGGGSSQPPSAPATLGPDTLLWLRWLPMPSAAPAGSPLYRLEAARADGGALGVVADRAVGVRLTGGGRLLVVSTWTPGPHGSVLKHEAHDHVLGTSRILFERVLDPDSGLGSAREGDPSGLLDVSPDGRREAEVYVRRGADHLEIAERAPDGSRGVTLRSEPVPRGWRARTVVLSPQGDHVAVLLHPAARSPGAPPAAAFWLVPADVDASPRLSLVRVHDPLWAPDGAACYAVWDRDTDRAGEIIAVSVDPAALPRTVLPGGRVLRFCLQWDGPGRLAFVEIARDATGTHWPGALRAIAAEGGAPSDLVPHGVLGFAPHPRGWALFLVAGERPGTESAPEAWEKLIGRVVVRDRDTGQESLVAGDLPVGGHLSLTTRLEWTGLPAWPPSLGWTGAK